MFMIMLICHDYFRSQIAHPQVINIDLIEPLIPPLIIIKSQITFYGQFLTHLMPQHTNQSFIINLHFSHYKLVTNYEFTLQMITILYLINHFTL